MYEMTEFNTSSINDNINQQNEHHLYQSVEQSNTDYTELLKQMNDLKSIIIDLNTVIHSQDELIVNSSDNLQHLNLKIRDITCKLESIDDKNQVGMLRSIFDNIVTLTGVLSVNTPILIAFGLKTGIVTIPFTYLFYKYLR
jgi:phosphomevalonate kinase